MTAKETTYKKPRIEKFKGKFKSIKGGGTILFTKTIQSITDPNCLAVYVYLASKPPEWNLNIKEIVNHFKKMGRDKAYKAINDLCLIGLLERKELRTEAGQFKEFIYYLYLCPLPENQEVAYPLPEKPDTVKPDTVNQEAYKEKIDCIKRKDIKKEFLKGNISSSNSKDKKPTQTDLQEYKAGIKGYEWVGDCLAKHDKN